MTALALIALVAACGDDTDPDPAADAGGDPSPDAEVEPPDGGGDPVQMYEFESRFVDGESSVVYTGQALRQVLISDLTAYVNALSATAPENFPADVLADLLFYYEFDGAAGGEVAPLLTTDPATAQATYGAIGSGNLVTKIAGNDAMGQHKDWNTPGNFAGWSATDATTPDGLARFFMAEIDKLADAFAAGNAPNDPDGNQIASAYVSADGRDYKQLLQKFLLGAVTYSQATDDYWDDADADHGLNVDNEVAVEGKPYTALEHHFDEGYGYFGAARDYLAYTDDELASATPYRDTDGDDAIDLTAEYNFGISTNAAKRDRGSAAAAPTDFTAEIFAELLAARTLIATAGGNLDEAEMAELQAHRDAAVLGWEKVLAATIIHYINETLQDMNAFGTDQYVFLDHAKHWSEMKGFALGLQFNPRKQLTDQEFVLLHTYLGDAPVLPGAAGAVVDAYRDALLDARALLADAYGFDPANVGDDNGENGW